MEVEQKLKGLKEKFRSKKKRLSEKREDASQMIDKVVDKLHERGYAAVPDKSSRIWMRWGIDTDAPEEVKEEVFKQVLIENSEEKNE